MVNHTLFYIVNIVIVIYTVDFSNGTFNTTIDIFTELLDNGIASVAYIINGGKELNLTSKSQANYSQMSNMERIALTV